MNRVKRWTTAVTARLDQVLGQVENHEALADAVIRDVRRASAEAKVRLARVRQDGEKLGRELAGHREARRQWRDRARDCAGEDEERALECLRRARRAEAAVPELERRLEAHRRIEKRLAKDIERVEARLGELASRRNLMRTRQSRAEALAGARGADEAGGVSLQDVFDRWEIQITELELDGEPVTGHDVLAASFDEAEERSALRAELAELVATQEKSEEAT